MSLDPQAILEQNLRVHITACVIEMKIPGSRSLKEKRGRILPLISQLKSRFGLAAAEIARQDVQDGATVACVAVSTDTAQNERVLQSALHWIETHRPDMEIIDAQIEER
jgi:uncharacterized protein YlxP (DUF503 family)